MIWRRRDPDRWRKCFAWHPLRVGDHWIWFARYAWRPLRRDESPKGGLTYEYWQEWSLPNGYLVWRCTTVYSPGLHSSNCWLPPKPKLKVVS